MKKHFCDKCGREIYFSSDAKSLRAYRFDLNLRAPLPSVRSRFEFCASCYKEVFPEHFEEIEKRLIARAEATR